MKTTLTCLVIMEFFDRMDIFHTFSVLHGVSTSPIQNLVRGKKIGKEC